MTELIMEKPCCAIRLKLAEEFATAARLYGECVAYLASSISSGDYVRLCKRTQEARDRSDAASIAFEEHVEFHRCYDGGTGIRKAASVRGTA
jgi:hypothetical protein